MTERRSDDTCRTTSFGPNSTVPEVGDHRGYRRPSTARIDQTTDPCISGLTTTRPVPTDRTVETDEEVTGVPARRGTQTTRRWRRSHGSTDLSRPSERVLPSSRTRTSHPTPGARRSSTTVARTGSAPRSPTHRAGTSTQSSSCTTTPRRCTTSCGRTRRRSTPRWRCHRQRVTLGR